MTNPAKRMPFGGEFSPGQIDLLDVLAVCRASTTNPEAIESIRQRYFAKSALTYAEPKRKEQQTKRANNVLIGLRSYGVLKPASIEFTDFGAMLAGLIGTPKASERIHDELARHILVELHGMELIEILETLQRQGVVVSKKSLSAAMRAQGFEVPTASTKHLVLLNWLRLAGVVERDTYEINRTRIGELLGTTSTIGDDLADLSQSERVFLRALSRMTSGDDWVPLTAVFQYAKELFGLGVAEDRWQALLIAPLVKKGWIEALRGTAGRGSRSGQVRGTGQFRSEYVRRLIEEDAAEIPAGLRSGLQRPLADIVADLKSTNTYVKGIALELLALRLTQLLDLKYRKFRLRAPQTGGAEVDLIVEGTRLLFSRWQIQCKNTGTVTLDDLAKEVGLATMLRSHVVLLVTTGRMTKPVLEHARRVNEISSLQVVLVAGDALRRVVDAGSEAGPVLVRELNTQAESALSHKSMQIANLQEDGIPQTPDGSDTISANPPSKTRVTKIAKAPRPRAHR